MKKTNRKSTKKIVETIVMVIMFVAVVAAFIYVKRGKIYIGGIILDDIVMSTWIFVSWILYAIFVFGGNKRKQERTKDEDKADAPEGIMGWIAYTTFVLVLLIFAIYHNVSLNQRSTIVEEKIGSAGDILLVEEKSEDSDTIYDIHVYYIDGVRLKSIGYMVVVYHNHEPLIKDGRYKLEYNDDMVTMYYYFKDSDSYIARTYVTEECDEYVKCEYPIKR